MWIYAKNKIWNGDARSILEGGTHISNLWQDIECGAYISKEDSQLLKICPKRLQWVSWKIWWTGPGRQAWIVPLFSISYKIVMIHQNIQYSMT